MKKRKIEITYESDEVFVVRRRRRSTPPVCPTCGGTAMMSLTAAAESYGREASQLLREMADGRVHFLETGDGALLICTASIVSHNPPPST